MYHHRLGQELPESQRQQELFERIVGLARQYFPGETAKAETWIQEQMLRYGIMQAKETATNVSQSPWLWLGAGALIALLLRR